MTNLKIIKATYFDAKMRDERGADVTEELAAEIVDNKLFYNGIYNLIFSDPFVNKHKRLKVEIEYSGKKFTKFYNENEKINLPRDLGEISENQAPVKKAHQNIFGDYVAGDKIGRDKNVQKSSKDVPLWLKWAVATVTILAFGWGVYIYFNPNKLVLNPITSLTSGRDDFATTTPNLSSIFLKINSMLDLEKENFLKDFENAPVYALGAAFENINGSGDGFIVRMTVERNEVGCAFSSDFKKELLLLKKGGKVNFYGIFTGSGLGGYGAVTPWYITDCNLLK